MGKGGRGGGDHKGEQVEPTLPTDSKIYGTHMYMIFRTPPRKQLHPNLSVTHTTYLTHTNARDNTLQNGPIKTSETGALKSLTANHKHPLSLAWRRISSAIEQLNK